MVWSSHPIACDGYQQLLITSASNAFVAPQLVRENPDDPCTDRVQSELIPLMLCLFFCFVFVDAENLFHVGFVYQQLAHFTPHC